MMVTVARVLVALFVFTLVCEGRAEGQIDEAHAKLAAEVLVRKNLLSEPTSHPLRTSRREDWEDNLFRLQVKIKGQIAKAAYFFEISESGYFVLSPEESVFVSSTDGERSWVVAVQSSDGAAYGLYGFLNGDMEFNRLAKSAQLNVQSEADAATVALLFYATVRDPRQQTIVLSSRQLKRKTEDYFLSKLPETKADSQASDWWHGFVAANLIDQLGVKSTPKNGGFGISITHMSSDDKRLGLGVLNMTVNRTGSCEATSTTLLYRLPK